MTRLSYYYAVLNLEPGSTKEEIKRAYRKLAQQWHPDKFSKKPEQLQAAREKFERVKEAYDKLIHLPYTEVPLSKTNTETNVSARPASAKDYYEEGIALLQVGDRNQAIECFTRAIRRKPNYLKAYQARAFTLEKLGLDRWAQTDFEKIAELKRRYSSATHSKTDTTDLADADIAFQRGLSQFKARKYGAAIENFTIAIRINPKHVEAYRYRSQAYFHRGYDEQADADFSRMRDLEKRAKGSASAATQKPSSTPTWQCIHTLSRHTSVVSAVAITRDGKKLVTGSYDQTLRLWNIKNGSLLKTFSDHKKEIHCVAISGDGKFVASGSADKTIKIWDLRTGALLRSIGNLLIGHSDTIKALAFSPNNQFLASASLDKTIRLWSVKSGKEIYALKDHSDIILTLAMSWDGKTIVYGGNGAQLNVRHTKTGKLIRSFPTSGKPNRAVAFSRQGSLLAAGSGANIVIWHRQSQKKLFELKKHTQPVSSLTFRADSQILVSGSHDKTIRLWNLNTGENIATLIGHQAAVCSVAYSLEGKVIASSGVDNTVKIWQQV
ncbi:MAG: DnaJ domain-containing protein [Leptolyngbya sp. SIO3F4]|nr:DnaJ domain-containing protein [Leptolyngbya sp. SIO3F4]